MEEYPLDNGKKVDLFKLRYDGRNERVYADGRSVLVRACHDVLINYKGGILLVTRDSEPAKGNLWSIGGGIWRGVPTEESLRELAKRECGLGLRNIRMLGLARLMFQRSPYENNKGIDDLGLMYFATGEGDLKLDKMHKNPIIVTPKKYLELKKDLHPYIQHFMDMVIDKI